MKITIEVDNKEFLDKLVEFIHSNKKKEVKAKYKYDWSKVLDNIMWIATDRRYSYGLVWGYLLEPEQVSVADDEYWDVKGGSLRTGKNYFKLKLTPYSGNWKDSLERRPKEFGG